VPIALRNSRSLGGSRLGGGDPSGALLVLDLSAPITMWQAAGHVARELRNRAIGLRGHYTVDPETTVAMSSES
jgi:hypothetical protein